MVRAIIFTMLLSPAIVRAQVSTPDSVRIDSLVRLGRDKLIALAVREHGDKDFDPGPYDRIVVKENRKSLLVEFGLSVAFSKRRCFYDDITVALIGNGDSKGADATDCHGDPRYYRLSASDRRKIRFIFKCINRKNEIGDVPDGKLPGGTRMEIRQRPFAFTVRTISWSTASDFKISRLSGRIFDANHKHFARRGNIPVSDFKIIQ